MDLYEAVHVRKSIRSYSREPVEGNLKGHILEFASHLFSLNEQRVGYEIMERLQLQKSPEIFYQRAPYYLTVYSEVCDGYEENAGYVMQQIALYMITKGLGCCFLDHVVYIKDKIQDMIPVLTLSFGWPKKKSIYKGKEKVKRLPMRVLCTMKETVSPEILEVLQAARLAPSFRNSQPWRFVVYQNRVHIFYYCRSGSWWKKNRGYGIGRVNRIDMGIMLANFLLISEQLWLETELVRLENIVEQEVKHNQYFLTVRFKQT